MIKRLFLFLFLALFLSSLSFSAVTVAATNNNGGGNDATPDISLPANISAGDLLIICVSTDGDNTVTNWDGFNELFSVSHATNATSLHIAYKVASGSEGATHTITTSQAEAFAAVTFRITGDGSGSNAPEVAASAEGLSVSPDPNSLSPSGGSKAYLWIPVYGADDDDTASAFPEAGNNITLNPAQGGSGCTIAVCTLASETDAYDSGAFTNGQSEQWVATTIVVYPSSGEVYIPKVIFIK